MMNDDEILKTIRERIDRIDQQLQALIVERAEAAREVAGIKLKADPKAEFYRPEREAEVLRRIKTRETPGSCGVTDRIRPGRADQNRICSIPTI